MAETEFTNFMLKRKTDKQWADILYIQTLFNAKK